jgi:hypothetical protein
MHLPLHAVDAALDAVPVPVARAAHDLGLAAWFGGAYMGAIALNGASREVDDPTQRLRVASAGWFRWAAIVPMAVGVHLAGAAALSRRSGEPRGAAERAVAHLRLAALGVALAVTAASGQQGRTVAEAGDVPTATAVQPIAATPDEVARAMGVLRVLQWAIPAATATCIAIDAWQQSHGGTRALPTRWVRALGRR